MTPEKRFHANYRVVGDCWIWQRAKDRDGYGAIYVRGRQMRAHRFSWEMSNGQIPEGLFVLHRCDVPSCVRPDHLFLGTNRDNMLDARAKGRLAVGDRCGARTRPDRVLRGEAVGTSKLTDAQVREIRVRYYLHGEFQQAIADAFGMSNQQVSNIVRGASRRTA